jgi:integrase
VKVSVNRTQDEQLPGILNYSAETRPLLANAGKPDWFTIQNQIMKSRFILFRRGEVYYCEDTQTKKQQSLRTRNASEAQTLLHAKNESFRQPVLNRQIARTYLAATDPEVAKRTWQTPMDEMTKLKQGATLERCRRAMQDKAFDIIRNIPILETNSMQFLKVLELGAVATNVFLRRIHNFALDMNWLPWPVLAKKQWTPVRFKEKRAITFDEHQAIIERERNEEYRAFYCLLWHFGGSQTDIASLRAENIDWNQGMISYSRRKTDSICHLRFGVEVETILRPRPACGPLFPRLALMHEKHRAKEFKRRCIGLGIEGVTLHSYRYAWAERARTCGFPERFAQEALGHASKAVARAYAKQAKVLVPSLEEYEHKIIPLPNAKSAR